MKTQRTIPLFTCQVFNASGDIVASGKSYKRDKSIRIAANRAPMDFPGISVRVVAEK